VTDLAAATTPRRFPSVVDRAPIAMRRREYACRSGLAGGNARSA
jgi:hypothetical protein